FQQPLQASFGTERFLHQNTNLADIAHSHRSSPRSKVPVKTLIEANDGSLYLQIGSYTSHVTIQFV
ncbi:MAG TPA: hypothetical protein VLI90_12760, partial [Tepidisphaeraceae bacterium]|nr:hypothetical protein [Tepidisphaeraceae bacterium]